jgi:hypothetical protein
MVSKNQNARCRIGLDVEKFWAFLRYLAVFSGFCIATKAGSLF